jgi:formyl-CoA transferase
MKEALEHEQVKHLGMVQEVESPRLGKQKLVGQPVIMSRTPSKIARATPKRGEHTEEILAELGFAKAELEKMKTAGVY